MATLSLQTIVVLSLFSLICVKSNLNFFPNVPLVQHIGYDFLE